MDKYYLRAIRIAAKNKLADRWTHSQWYQPLDAEDAGTTFVLIEVVNPWFPAPQITTTITNTFNREYFRQRRVSSATDSFEIAVRRVNEALAARAEEGETDWIGNLHAILAVVAGNELHFVATGKALGFIYRDSTVSPVTEHRPSDDPPAPLNTFVNIITGSLQPGDKGVFATPDLAKYLDNGELAAALANPVDAAAKEIVRRLQEQRIKTPHAVIFDYSALPHPDRGPNDPDTIFVDVPLVGGFTRARHVARETVLPVLARGVAATGSAAGWFWGKARSDFFPRVRQGVSSIAQRGKKGMTDAAQKAAPVVSSVAEKAQDKLSHVAMRAESMNAQSVATKSVSLLARLLNGLSSLAQTVRLRSRLLFAALAIVVVAVVGIRYFTVGRQHESKQEQEQAQQALAAAQSKKQEGDLAVVYNENDKAIAAFIEAIDLATRAKQSPSVRSAADDVIKGAQTSLDTLTNTTRISGAEAVATFTIDSVRLALIDSQPWTVDSAGTVAAPPSQELKLSDLGSMIGTGYIADTKRLFVVGSRNVGMVLTDRATASVLTAPEGGWQPAKAVDAYSTFLYFLDPDTGQIWKYSTDADGVATTPAASYFTDVQNFTGALDLAIDGNIYVLFSNGTINKYFKGAAKAFTVSGLPKPYEQLAKPILIASDAAATGVYVYDGEGKRIVELDKSGAYRRQFALPESWDVKDIVVSGASQKLYVLAGKNVYEIGL